MSEFVLSRPERVANLRTGFLAGIIVLSVVGASLVLGHAREVRQDIATNTHLVERSSNLDRGTTSEDVFYSGDTLQLAQTNVQTDLQDIADAVAAQVETIRASEIEEVDGNIRLGIVLNGIVPEATLGTFIGSIAQNQPALFVEKLSLRRARTSRRQSGERFISFQIEVAGFAAK